MSNYKRMSLMTEDTGLYGHMPIVAEASVISPGWFLLGRREVACGSHEAMEAARRLLSGACLLEDGRR